MKPLRVLIADDEKMARHRLTRLLSSMPGVEIVASCEDGQQVLLALEQVDVDVALLDIQMPKTTGLEVADVASEWGIEVVFVSAHPDHAVDAFAKGVVDYVLKPVDAERLALAMTRVRSRLDKPEVRAMAVESHDRLGFAVGNDVRLVDPVEISHAVIEGELTTVWLMNESLLSEATLADLERRLPEPDFVRVHRRALIRFEHVVRLKGLPSGGYLALMKNGQEVPVSRQAARGLRKRLGIV